MSAPVSTSSKSAIKRPRKPVAEGSAVDACPIPEKKAKSAKTAKPTKTDEAKSSSESDEKADASDKDTKKSKRLFTVTDVRLENGEALEFDASKQWPAKSPSGAASKAAGRIYKEKYGMSKDRLTSIVSVKEYTKPVRETKASKKAAELAAALEAESGRKRKAPKPPAEKKEYHYTVVRVPAVDRKPAVFKQGQEGGETKETAVPFQFDMLTHKYVKPEATEEVRASA